MLKTIAGMVLLTMIAFVGYRRTFMRLPLGARLVYLTGTEYILVGFALGGRMIGLLDEAAIRSLIPLFSLGLGLIGMILGIQLEVGKLRRFPAGWIQITLLQALATMIVVFVPVYALLGAVFGVADGKVLLASLVLAATAGCTAQSALVLLSREFGLRHSHLMRLLRYISGLDAAVALLVFGVAYCLLHPMSGTGIAGFPIALALGLVLGFLLHLLTRFRCSEEELLLFVTGTVLFGAGMASYFRLSPLFTNFVAGVVATNLPGSKARILNLLAGLEQPCYVIFLVLAGAVWRPAAAWALPLAGVYVGLRILGKLAGGFLATRRVEPRPPAALGLGLVSQGGVVIAMVMDYYQMGGTEVAGGVATAVILGVIASELAGPGLTLRLLCRAGEVRR